jgi:hypothetical protein
LRRGTCGIVVAQPPFMEFLARLENLGPVTWIRESSSLLGYTLYLAAHTIGLVFLVGPNLIIAARVLGLAPDIAIRPLARFKPIMTIGLALTVVTGGVLFATAPVSYVRNPVFIVKIAAVIAAVVCLRGVVRAMSAGGQDAEALPVSGRTKALTAATLVLWTIAVVAGRLTAYSGVVVLASVMAFGVVAAITACGIALTGVFRPRRRHEQSAAFALPVHRTAVSGGK